MSIKSLISVYIISHNYARYLEDAIESVLRQTIDNWELLLIDDGSTDETPEIISLYRDHPKINTFKTDGIGLPAACNLALNSANGEYLIRLDGDDIFDENILLILSHYLDLDPDLALVFPDYYLVDDSGEIFSQERRRRVHENDHLMDLPPNGACTMIRLSILIALGGYREDLGAQDGLDLWVKIKDSYKVTNVNLPLFYYRRHGKNLTEKPLRIINARRELKKTAALKKLQKIRPVIAIIPCRTHYDFILNLWNQKLGGKSLLERDIDACVSSSMIDYIVVTCDNLDVKSVVDKYNDPRVTFIERDEKSTLRSSRITDTLKVVVDLLDPEFNGITLMRYVQTPFISTGTLEEAIASLVVSESNSACAVEEIHSRIYKRTQFGLVPVDDNYSNITTTGSLYRDASTCIALRNKNIKKGSLTGSKMAGFVVSAAESFFISSSHDMDIARSLLENK